ncbi:MAG: hypothetical protein OXI60_12380 [Acidiferrobacterales bacterium]|nr:hypothetical protein [Acidiferrobacterales bacterium]
MRAAEYHGASHQASMVFQVIAPRQLRPIQIGRHKVQFIFQSPRRFKYVNKPEWLVQMKSSSGFAKVAGVELTLFDCSRYFRKTAGLDYVAQIVKDIGGSADSINLSALATANENTTLRRLGYLLDNMGHHDQAAALLPFVSRAKSLKPLDPSISDLPNEFALKNEVNSKWKLVINQKLATDY